MEFKQYCTGVQHIVLPTLDMAATLAFYQGLGFKIAYETVNGGCRVVFLRLGSLTIETYESPDAVQSVGAIAHVALNVTDVDAVWKLANQTGLRLLDPEIRFLPFWEKGTRFFNVLGPNGEIVEFSQIL